MRNETTDYGFNYGAAKVTRIANDGEAVIIGVETPKTTISIRVTKTGKMTIYNNVGDIAKFKG